MATYNEIKQFLNTETFNLELGQFGIDWIENEIEHWETIESGQKPDEFIDDETANGSTHYSATTVLEVLKDGAPCRPFFERLAAMTSKGGTLTREVIEQWKRESGYGLSVARRESLRQGRWGAVKATVTPTPMDSTSQDLQAVRAERDALYSALCSAFRVLGPTYHVIAHGGAVKFADCSDGRCKMAHEEIAKVAGPSPARGSGF